MKSAEAVYSTVREIDEMGSKTLTGKVALTKKEYEDLTALAKEGITSHWTIEEQKTRLSKLSSQLWQLKNQFDEIFDQTKPFREAMKLAPARVKELFTDIFKEAKEAKEQRQQQRKQRPRGRER